MRMSRRSRDYKDGDQHDGFYACCFAQIEAVSIELKVIYNGKL